MPPVVARGPGFADELADRLSQACGLPVITDMSAVLEAMRAMKLRTLAMATPFRPFINERLVKYLASEQITIMHLGSNETQKFAGCRFQWNTI